MLKKLKNFCTFPAEKNKPLITIKYYCMKRLLVLVLFLCSIFHAAKADKYYWVGNGGDWSDVANHWAVTTGGAVMHSSVPGANDTVYFDANSFTLTNQSVNFDTTISECAMMDWSGITVHVYFFSGPTDTLRIHGSCILSNNLTFNFGGVLEIDAHNPLAAKLDFANNSLACDVVLTSDSVKLLSRLYLPYNRLSFVGGLFYTNGYSVTCLHFNTDTTLKNSIPVVNPEWYSNDTLTIKGSMAISNQMDFMQNGPVYLAFNFLDTNYVNLYANSIPGKIIFSGNKKMLLLSPLSVTGGIEMIGGGKFYTRGYALNAAFLTSVTPLTRTIDLSSSIITLNASGNTLYFQSQGLTLKSDTAILQFIYSGPDTVIIRTGKDFVNTFKEVHLPQSNVMLFNSFKTSLLAFNSGSNVALARGITITVNSITSAGDCKNYNYIKAFCPSCPLCDDDLGCISPRPILKSTNSISADFLKLKSIEAQGIFVANNSFDEGNNSGWTINEPAYSGDLYWRNGSGNWNDPGHWSTTPVVFTEACIPSRNTNVIFDNLSFSSDDTVAVDGYAYCNNMTWTNNTYEGIINGSGFLAVGGNLVLCPMSHFENSGGFKLQKFVAGTDTIDGNGADIKCDIEINGAGANLWRLTDTLNFKGSLKLIGGTLNLNTNDLHCNSLLSGGSLPRSLNYSNSTIFLDGSDTTWRSTGSNLTLVNNSASICLVGTGTDFMLVDAGNRNFDTLDIRCAKARIAGGANFKLMKIMPGALLECEPLQTIRFDSIVASGSCTEPITLSNYSGSADTALFMMNGADTMNIISVDNVIIKNVCAIDDTSHIYNALNSIGLNKFSGWNITGGGAGKTYYWSGLQSTLWNDRLNWKVNNVTALCLPGPMDTVVFDSIHFAVPGSHDTVMIETNAYCGSMIWDPKITRQPALLLQSDMTVSGSVVMCDTLAVGYTNMYQSSDINAPRFIFSPQNRNSNFTPSNHINVNLSIEGKNISDTVRLLKNLLLDTLNTINILSGTFSSGQKDIYAGVFKTSGDKQKRVNFSNSRITAAYNFTMQDASLLNLNMDASELLLGFNSTGYTIFDGGSQKYSYVEFRYKEPDTDGAYYRVDILSSDTTELLKINAGLHVWLKSGIVQSFDSIIINATCLDSIFLSSSNPGNIATLTKTGGSGFYGTCLNLKDISATFGASALFSKNLGNNPGWLFDSSKQTTALFSLPPTTCFNDSIHFTNLSSTYFGGAGMEFLWSFGDNSSSTLSAPSHFYANNTSYVVSLISTDTATGCIDTYIDTLTIYKPEATLSTSEADFIICMGDTVTFNAHSTTPNPSYVYMVAGDSIVPSDSVYKTPDLNNGDEVFVILTYQGCVDTSDHYTYTVNSLPIVSLVSDEPDTTICEADTIIFTGNGADKYQLYRNGTAFGSFSTTNQWIIPSAVNGDLFTLFGQNTTTGCGKTSPDSLTVTVNPLPLVTLTCSDPDLTICSGTTVVFDAGNANFYQFLLNGDTLGSTTAIDTLAISTLSNGDNMIVAGVSTEGCIGFSSTFLEFNVMPTPVVSLSSSDPDNVICNGDLVTFQASGADVYQFSINGDTIGPFSATDNFSIDSLVNQQIITVEGILGVCPAQADSVIVMDVRPLITWTWSANEICANDTIRFMAHGDSVYRFFINGSPVTPLGHDSVFFASGLSDGQYISVGGTSGACTPVPLLVTVNPIPVAPMTCSEPDTTICEGELITFMGSGADKYQFSVDGDTTGAFSFFNTFSSGSITNGQVVTMEAISTEGCRATSPDSYTVAVHTSPVVALSQSDPDTTICAGDTVSFMAGGADTFEFFINGVSQGPTGPDPVFTTSSLLNGAVVTVKGTLGLCSSTSSNAYTYTVNQYPVVTFTPLSPLNYCTGDTLTLIAGGASSYEFFIDGTSTGAPSGNNIFSSTAVTNGQTISVAGSQAGCLSVSDNNFTVAVNNYPVVGLTVNTAGPDICYGDTITFEGTGAQEYIFYLDGIPVSEDSVFSTSNLEEGQVINLHGGNGACWSVADTAISINVNYIDIGLTCAPSAGVVCEGDPVTFSATGADLYEFYLDGISQGAPSSNGNFNPAFISDGQLVSVQGTALGTGCVQEAFDNILVHVLPVPEVTVTPDANFCEGDSALLESSVAEGLSWYLDGTLIAGETSQELYVHTGGTFTLETTSGGSDAVFSVGANYFGQLGDATLNNSLIFNPASSITGTSDVACGAEYTLALMNDGSVRSWGKNEFGSLGNGTFTNSSIPVSVGSISNAIRIAAGKRFGLAILQDNSLVSWGENTYGQLGYGNYSTSNFPNMVTSLTQVIDIAAGDDHGVAVTADGKVWAWGHNNYGQLGDSTLVTKNIPVQVHGIDNVVAVRAGGNHSMALKNDGTLWVWGANNYGQLGNGSYDGSLVPVKVNLPLPVTGFDGGFGHSVAVDSANHVYTWGDNSLGQLGISSLSNALYPVKIIKAGAAKLVRAGQYSSYVIRTDDNVFSWGANDYGQLGQQHTNPVNEPEAINSLFGIGSIDGGNYHCAIVSKLQHHCTSSDIIIQMDTVPAVQIFQNGLTLHTPVQGIQYQWYYQGNIIPGATDSVINIIAEGTYMVQVTFANGCSAFSDEFNYFVGMQETNKETMLSLYPNPNTGSFHIQLSAGSGILLKPENLRIVDMLGQKISWSAPDMNSEDFMINLQGVSNGVYTIELQVNENTLLRKRFVVEK